MQQQSNKSTSGEKNFTQKEQEVPKHLRYLSKWRLDALRYIFRGKV